MLGKYLNHEFKNTGRLLLPAFIISISITLLFSLSTFIYMTANSRSEQPELGAAFITVGFMMFFFIILGITIGVSFLLIICRFYQTMAGREAYLTHTLPIKTSHLLLAKLINAFLWCLLIGAMAVLCFFIFITISYGLSNFPDYEITAMDEFLSGLKEGLDMIDIKFSYVVLWIFSGILQLLNIILHFFTAIALGQLVKKHRIFGAIGFYLAISSIQRTLLMIFQTTYMLRSMKQLMESEVQSFAYLLFTLILFLALDVVFFFTTNYIFSRQLNLE